jgi:hypothetical protein
MPIRVIDKQSVGETPTGATETVALPGTQKLSVNRIGTKAFMKRSWFLARIFQCERR